MITTRKILTAAIMSLTAIALAASTAAAQETAVEFETEAGDPCNPCLIHAEGEASIFDATQPGQPEVSSCHNEYDMMLYHAGTGEIEWVGVTHPVDPGPGCNTVNCSNPEGHWPLSGVGERADGTVHYTRRSCLNNLHCNAEVSVTEEGAHHYLHSMDQLCFGGARRLVGTWETEGDSDFEMDHTPGD
jgi:hypothetical protein